MRLIGPAVLAVACWSVCCMASVREFTSTELYQMVQSMQVNVTNEPWLILFHVNYCLHCLRLQPIMVDVEKRLRYTGIRVGKLDCTRDHVSGHFFHLTGFPTIRFYHGKTEFSFHGARNEERLVRFAKRAYSPAVRQLSSTANFLETLRELESEAFFFLGCRTASCGHESDRSATLNVAFGGGSDGASGHRRLSEVNLLPLFFSVARRYQTQTEFFYGAAEVIPSYLLTARRDRDWSALVSSAEQTLFVFKDGTFFAFGLDTEVQESELLGEKYADMVNVSLVNFVNEERFTRFPIVTEFDLHEFHTVHKLLVAFVLRNTTAANREVNADGAAQQYSMPLDSDDDSAKVKAKETDELARLSDRVGQFGELLAKERTKFHGHFSLVRLIGEFEWVSSIVIERVSGPALLVYDAHFDRHVYLSSEKLTELTQMELSSFLEAVRDGEVAFQGGTTSYSMKRSLFTLAVGIYELIFGAPILALILFGLPSFIVGLLVYACCCMSDKPKPKKPQPATQVSGVQKDVTKANAGAVTKVTNANVSVDSTVRRRAPDRVMALPRIGDSEELASRIGRPAEYDSAAQQLSGLMRAAAPSRLFGFGASSSANEADSHLKNE